MLIYSVKKKLQYCTCRHSVAIIEENVLITVGSNNIEEKRYC